MPDGTLFQFCPNCVVQLSGPGGVFVTGAGAGGSFSIAKVPAGTYRIDRVCGNTTVGAMAPWNQKLGYAAVTVPTGPIDILVPKCP